MANKILKTLTLPNAQGEPVTYELHPEWDNIENKNYEYIVQASFVDGGNSLGRQDITLIDFNWENLIQAIQENKRVICRMTDKDSLFYTDFLFTEYTKGPPCVHFVCSDIGYIENFFIYSNGDINYGKRKTYTDSTLTEGGVPAEAKATGDALNRKLSVATTTGTGEAYTATIPNAGPITEGFTFIMIPHTDSTSDTINLSVNGVAAQLVKTDSQQTGLHNATIYAGRAYMVTKQANPSFWAITNSSKVLAEDVVGCGLKNALGYSFDYIDTLKDTGWYWTFLSDASEGTTICGYSLQIGFPYMLHVENGNNKAVAKQTLTLPLYNGEVILTRSTDFDGVWHDWKEIVMTDKIPPNPNLLDNWYFADPVNQRGATTYTAEDYCIDRWYFEQWSNTSPKVELKAGYIAISCTDAQGDTNTNCIKQTIEKPSLYSGKTVTFSVKFKGVAVDGDPRMIIYSEGASGTKVAYKAITASAADSILSVTTTLQSGLTRLMVVVGNYANNGGDGNFTLEIESVKLEFGSVSTLANDAPPDKALELLKCQRYFWKCAGYNAYTGYKSTTAYAFIQTPVLMRTTPTATLGSTNYIYGANGRAVFSGTDIVSSIQQQGQFIRLVLNESKADTTQSSYTGYTFVTGESGISLSAEI